MLSLRKHFLFWIAAAFIATAALVTMLIWERRPVPAQHTLYTVGVAERGEALFFGEKQCSICHSINGSGGRIAPDLSGKRAGTPAMGWLATVLWNHAPGMFRRLHGSQSYPQLDSQEMADVLAFLYQAGNADPPGDARAGEKVFREKSCVTCHSVHSVGGHSAPDLSSIAAAGRNEWVRAMWNHSQAMIEPVTRALGRWPQFMGNEMNDLVAFVTEGQFTNVQKKPAAGNAERGWKAFQAGCIQCHAVRGQGGNSGPELGPEHDLPLSTTTFASVLWNHAPSMAELSKTKGITLPIFQRDEMADLAAFLASLRYFEPSGSSFVGQRVFIVRGCAACHGPEADGSKLGPRIRAKGDQYTTVSFTSALWKHGPRMINRAEALGVAWPRLEATDIGDLVTFLNTPQQTK